MTFLFSIGFCKIDKMFFHSIHHLPKHCLLNAPNPQDCKMIDFEQNGAQTYYNFNYIEFKNH